MNRARTAYLDIADELSAVALETPAWRQEWIDSEIDLGDARLARSWALEHGLPWPPPPDVDDAQRLLDDAEL